MTASRAIDIAWKIAHKRIGKSMLEAHAAQAMLVYIYDKIGGQQQYSNKVKVIVIVKGILALQCSYIFWYVCGGWDG